VHPTAASLQSAETATLGRSRRLRPALWATLVLLLLAAQALLVTLALHYRSARTQQAVEANVAALNDELSRLLARDLQATLALPEDTTAPGIWRARAQALLVSRPELLRIERRDVRLKIAEAVDTRSRLPLFSKLERSEAQIDTELACGAAEHRGGPAYSRSFFVPQSEGMGEEVMDLCVADRDEGRLVGFVVATYSLNGLLDALSTQQIRPGVDLSFIEADGSRLAHGHTRVGAGVYEASRLVDLPGSAMLLHVNSAATRPGLLPDLVTSLVIALSLGLFGVVMLLARDVRKRAGAEAALAEALAFRKAMEDSVVTGLRARDLHGVTSYVNPAFCAMVGFEPGELVGRASPPYWPAEQLADYQQRQRARMATLPGAQSREAFETVFVRKNGERFPAMVFEAPRRDGAERHTGWMSAVLDLSAQRRVEEVARQQQERLQATARLATVGEMASLLSHELNQPLSAIAAYATGSLNMMDAAARGEPPEPDLAAQLHQAAQRIAEQAERAGRVIKSVHDFVRRQERCAHRGRHKPADAKGRLRPRDGRAGAAEPDAQRHPGDAGRRFGPRARADAAGAPAAAAVAADLDRGPRAGRRRRRRGAALHPFLHDPRRRHGPGAERVPNDHRAAWRRAGLRQPARCRRLHRRG
jgi:two-component system sensor histidine kinase DctS